MKIRPSILLASISALVTTATTVSAVDFHWAAGTSDWETAANWNTNSVPGGGGGNFVYINNGGTVNINADTASIQDPFVGRGAGSSGTVNQLAGNHNNVGWMFVGDNGGTGTWNMQGSTNLTTGRLYLGGVRDGAAGGTGTFGMNSTGVAQFNSDLSIGTRGGSGTMNVTAGTINAASWFIIGETHGGLGSTGVINQTGGVVNNGTGDANGRFWMGSQENGAAVASTATYNISGGTLNARNVAVGRHYAGTIHQTGGTVNFTSGQEATNLGQFGGSTGIYNLSAGTLNTNGTFNVGDGGTGILNVSATGVANVTGGDGLRVGSNGGSGTLNLNGGTVSANFVNRLTGAGQINVNGGTVQARSAQGNFFQNLSDAQIDVRVGGLTFDTNNNAVTITQNLAGAGGLTKSGNGTLTLPGNATYAGATTVTGGKLEITGTPSYAGGVTINGGEFSVGAGGAIGTAPSAAVANAGGTFAINRSDDLTNTTTLTGAGNFAKNGANTVTIGAELNGLTGSVQVNAGKLANTAASDIAGAALSVNGGGALLPLGSAVGAINATAVTVGTNSTLNFDFSAGGATYDQIVSTGGVSFSGAYTINLFDVGTANPFSTNGTYSLFDYATSVSGSPAGFSIGNAVIGKSYQLADHSGTTTLQMTIADAVLVAWANTGSGLWSTAGNWSPALTPNVATADVNFTSAILAPSTVDIDGSKVSGKITFDNTNSYTVGGTGTLTVDNGLAAGSISTVTGNHFINTPVAVPNATTVSTATGTTLQVGDVSGAGAVTKTGDGTLTLNGATGSTGGLIVNGGVVQVGNGGATGSLPTGAISIAAGARISHNNTGTATVANNISGAGSVSQDAAGTVTNMGTSTYTGFTDLNAGTFNNNGSITGTSSIDINNSTNLAVGSTTSTTGNIVVGAGGTLTSAGTVSYNNKLSVNDGGSATINGGTVTGVENIYAAESGSGTITINGGMISAPRIWAGTSGGAVGNININAGRIDSNQWTSIGTAGGATGNITHTGGELNQNHTDWFSVGENGTSTYSMSGSSSLNNQAVVDTNVRGTNKGNIVMGRNTGSSGVWNLSDTASARVRRIQVGNAGGSTGVVNVGGTSTVVASEDIHIGQMGTGTINVAGGSVTTTSGWTQLGIDGGSTGTLNVSAGSIFQREVRIGLSGTGVVDVSGGTLTANQQVTLGINAAGNGTFKVRGTGAATVQNGGMIVGGTGVGSLYVEDTAALNINGNLVFGNGGGAPNGSGYVTGGTTAVNGEIWVGQGAATAGGTLNIGGGSVSANNWIAIGRAGATGTVNLGGTGSLTKTGGGHVVLGSLSGNGTLNQSGGTYNIAPGGGQTLLGENAGGIGNWTVGGGTATTNGIRVGWTGGGSGNFTLNGPATVNVGADGIIVSEGGPGVIAQTDGTLTVAGSIDVQGAGGNGIFAIAGGRLNVDGGIDTSNGTFLFGAGKISRSSAGLIDINGPLTTADPAATLKLDIDKTFDISGAFDNTTGLTLEVTGMGIPDGFYLGSPLTGSFPLGNIGGAITLGDDAFDILNTSLTGFDALFDLDGNSITATRIDESSTFNAASDSVFWVDEDGGVVTLQYSVVPEPSSMALVIGGLVVLARRRRRA